MREKKRIFSKLENFFVKKKIIFKLEIKIKNQTLKKIQKFQNWKINFQNVHMINAKKNFIHISSEIARKKRDSFSRLMFILIEKPFFFMRLSCLQIFIFGNAVEMDYLVSFLDARLAFYTYQVPFRTTGWIESNDFVLHVVGFNKILI